MSLFIVRPAPQAYVAAMRDAFAKLLLIAAMLLMPFAMSAPAAAAPLHHGPAVDAPAHCPDQAPDEQSGMADCTMGCAASLPAVEVSRPAALVAAVAPSPRRTVWPMPGLHPETATPPPRTA